MGAEPSIEFIIEKNLSFDRIDLIVRNPMFPDMKIIKSISSETYASNKNDEIEKIKSDLKKEYLEKYCN